MAFTLPRDIVARIKEETDIVGVVRAYVTLKAAGASFKGLCPFHSEKTPSFHVNPARQIYKCYGCDEGGDVISFIMKVEQLSFPEAVETLARPLDIDLSRYLVEDDGEGERLAFHRANEAAVTIWQEAFWSLAGEEARRYLLGRGFREETLRRFEVGYAAAGSSALQAALAKAGVSVELALRCGLLGRRGDEAPFAYFRHRAIFPIRNIAQRVAGFGGRVLGQGEPKYLNSPESTYFSKGKLLYGFSSSRIAAARLRTAILVEGYLDLLALAQAGFANCVATCGTAFTPEQARLLRRGSPTVLLLFDGDRAGLKASVRGCHVALTLGLEPRVAQLPAGEDPASFLQTNDADALRAVLAAAPDYLNFLHALVQGRGGRRTEKERALKQALTSIAQVPDAIRKAYLLQEAAELFEIHLAVLERQIQNLEIPAPRSAARGTGAFTPDVTAGGGVAAGGVAPTNVHDPGAGSGAGSGRTTGAGPHLDRAAIEREMLRHVLRDDSGQAAERWLELRGELPCGAPLAELLRRELGEWRRARARGEETSPAKYVQDNWNQLGGEYVRFVIELLASDLVPDKTDFVRAVQDGHRRLVEDEERQRRRAAAQAVRPVAADGLDTERQGSQGG